MNVRLRGLACFAILMSAASMRASVLRQGSVQVMCHRTANREMPENSLESLELAARLGCNVVEVDVRRTLDGVLVLNHDGYLDRFTGTTGDIETTDLRELERMDFGAWRGERFKGIRLARLGEALRVARERNISLYLDIKTKGLGAQILEAVAREGMSEHVVFGGEWDDIRAVHPRSNEDDLTYLQPEITAAQVEELHRKGKPAVANFLSNGHETDLPSMRRAVEAGVDAIWVEYPRLGAEAAGRPVEATLARLAAEAGSGAVSKRVDAIREYSAFTGYPVQPHLLHWLEDPNDAVSHAAALGLVSERPAASVAALAPALQSKSSTARRNAAWAIGELASDMRDSSCCARLLAPLLNDSEEGVIRAALIALAKCAQPNPGVVPSRRVIDLLRNASPVTSGLAAVVLADYDLEAGAREIPLRLRKEEAEAQAYDIAWAARGRTPLTQAEIDPIIEHYRAEMKYIQALAALPSERALGLLAAQAFRSARDYSSVTGLVAGFRLWDRLGSNPASAIEALASSDSDVADRAEWCLTAAGPRVLPPVRDALNDSTGEVRNRLIRILARQADVEAVPLLRRLRSTDPSESDLVHWALQRIEMMEVQ